VLVLVNEARSILKTICGVSTALEILEIYWDLISLLEILEISGNLIGPPRNCKMLVAKLASCSPSKLFGWHSDSVGQSSSSYAQLEIVHTLLVVVKL